MLLHQFLWIWPENVRIESNWQTLSLKRVLFVQDHVVYLSVQRHYCLDVVKTHLLAHIRISDLNIGELFLIIEEAIKRTNTHTSNHICIYSLLWCKLGIKGSHFCDPHSLQTLNTMLLTPLMLRYINPSIENISTRHN